LLAGIGILALAWRLGFFLRFQSSILFGSLEADSALFWARSARILNGDFASAHPFFFGPLYSYWLAAIRFLGARSIGSVLIIQYVMGSIAVVLIADAAHRLVGRRAAIVTGFLLALNPMLVFFDSQVLMESLLLFLQAGLLWLVIARGGGAIGWRRALLAGILIGAMAEGRAVFALLLGPLAVLLIASAAAARAALRPMLAMLAGTALIVSFSLAHNLRAGAGWTPFTYNFGYNLYVGNHPGAPGTFTKITGTADIGLDSSSAGRDGSEADGREYIRGLTGRQLTPVESSRYWVARAADYARHEPLEAALGFGRRVLMLWNGHEYPQIENADEFRALCGPLGLPVLGGFGLLAIAALIGLARAWGSGIDARWLMAHAGVLTLGIAAFFVTDRYRCHLIPATAVLSGFGLETVIAAFRERRVTRGAIAGLAAGLILVFAPLHYIHGARYEWGLNSDLGARWIARDPNRSLEYFERALALERTGRMKWRDNDEGRLERATVYHDYARALRLTGNFDAALSFEKQAAALAPESKSIQAAYAELSGKMAGAGGITERAWGAAQHGYYALAESLFARSVAADGHQPDAWAALVRLRVQRGDANGAEQALSEATRAGLGGASLVLHRALVAAARGDMASARRLLDQAPPEAASDPMLASVRQAVIRLELGARPGRASPGQP